MQPRLMATMVTTTSYGTWLPGDLRGYVDNGVVLRGDPERFDAAVRRMGGRSAMTFDAKQQTRLFDALYAAADEFGYRLTDVSIESWHAHWIVGHGFDPVATMVGRLKNRMRQALGNGRIWTAGYHSTLLFDPSAVLVRRGYIFRHDGCRMSDGRVLH